jgi:hypothetical protein
MDDASRNSVLNKIEDATSPVRTSIRRMDEAESQRAQEDVAALQKLVSDSVAASQQKIEQAAAQNHGRKQAAHRAKRIAEATRQANRIAALSRRAAERSFAGVKEVAYEDAAQDSLLINQRSVAEMQLAVEKWQNARDNARKLELREYESAEQSLLQQTNKATADEQSSIKDAETQNEKAVELAQHSHLHAYTSSAQQEATQKADAAESKAIAMEVIQAQPTQMAEVEDTKDAAPAPEAAVVETDQDAADAGTQGGEGQAPTLEGQHTEADIEKGAAEGGAWDTAADLDQNDDAPAADVLISLGEEAQQLPSSSLEGATSAADAQQQLADAGVREQGDQDAAAAKQEALLARQSIQKDQQAQISAAGNKFEQDKSAAEETMRAAKAQALETQKAELKKRSEDLEKEKASLDEDAEQQMADVKKQAELELSDQKATFEKTKQVLAADKTAAQTMAAQERDHAVKMAVENQKAALEATAEEKQKRMAAIALAPVEQAADGAIEAGPIDLIQIGEDPEDPSESSDGYMVNSAELKEQQGKERQEDEAKANQMIQDAKMSMDRVVSAKRTQDLELAEQEAITQAEQQAKAAVAAAEAQELKQHQEADDAYMTSEESVERKFREDKQRIDQKAAQNKIQATLQKNDEYDQATKMWETSKKEAREEQLDAFKAIETKQETAAKQYSEEYEASLESTKAKYQQEATHAESAKKRATAIANQNADLSLNKVADEAAKTQQEVVEQAAQTELVDDPTPTPPIEN